MKVLRCFYGLARVEREFEQAHPGVIGPVGSNPEDVSILPARAKNFLGCIPICLRWSLSDLTPLRRKTPARDQQETYCRYRAGELCELSGQSLMPGGYT